ncbi:XRE family transcriptional regulator [Methylobacterium sp. Leaf399]|uniref:DNA polymerase III subunit delta' n=1 Tax=unclassified Methylobacterium TaxID=2615210 RepID=UPI0006FE163E|nr:MULTISPECIES: DNA polymerase III subunit delta' [unclassified Methylobacterium]KQT18847.1 XRE family transcriptional regulator [Methylobacterium sp. Leaf399]KQT86903.1 XRE family transcriptional regulator [Methylobacterium sp. Leaf466]
MPPERSAETLEPGDLPDIPRPREQTALVGHGEAQAAIAAAIGSGRLHHAWLIGGPRGIGKATLAYRVARWLLAHPEAGPVPDDLEVPAGHPAARQVAILSHPNLKALRRTKPPGAKSLPTKISVDAARKALELFGATAGGAGYRICIVDSAEDLNANSANALLKMIEEPPPRSLFLVVSHAPGRLLPTIRSRCRALSLRPLGAGEVAQVIGGFPNPFVQPEPAALARAASLCEGSVARAVALLDPATAGLVTEVETLLARLDHPDWRRILALADKLAGRDADDLFAASLDTVFRFVSDELHRRRDEPPARLAALVEVCDGIARAAAEAATYNLDRRPLVLSLFGDLAASMRTPA